jgi:flagellar protein FlbD
LIRLTKLNGAPVGVNALFIETVEMVPDTVITLTTGKKMIVRETMEEVAERVTAFYRQVGLAAVTVRQSTEVADD